MTGDPQASVAAGDAELDHDEVDANAPEYYAADQAAMVEADRLQDEVADREAEPAGPYEHTGAYQGSELFDTTGVPKDFCSECEHAPCVSGEYTNWCTTSPRYLSVWRIRNEVRRLTDQHIPDWPSPVGQALTASTLALLTVASSRDTYADVAYCTLVEVLVCLRAELPEDES